MNSSLMRYLHVSALENKERIFVYRLMKKDVPFGTSFLDDQVFQNCTERIPSGQLYVLSASSHVACVMNSSPSVLLIEFALATKGTMTSVLVVI